MEDRQQRNAAGTLWARGEAYGELPVELLDEEVGVLVAIVLEAGWVVGQEIVVQVVVATHAHEEDAAAD